MRNDIYNICNSPMTFRLCILLALIGTTFSFSGALTAQDKAGAFIIVSLEGDVQVKDTAGEVVPAEDVAVGKSLFEVDKPLSLQKMPRYFCFCLMVQWSLLTPRVSCYWTNFSKSLLSLMLTLWLTTSKQNLVSQIQKLKLGYGELLF